MPRLKQYIYVAIAVVFLGLLFIWTNRDDSIKAPAPQPPSSAEPAVAEPAAVLPAPVSTPAASLAESLVSLQASLSGLLARIENLELTKTTSTVTPTSSTPQTVFRPETIYLGTASSHKREWTDVGAEATINSADYPANVKVVFEAGLSIPGGEAWARLKNKTTGAIISISEIYHNNSTVTWKSSASFNLHSGNYTYVVQLRSTSGETANLSGARLRISQ
jgi:hypothetical protein